MTTEEKIRDLQSELAKLEIEFEQERLIPKDVKLAEALHSRLCRWNHEDACSWHYCTWEKPDQTRKDYLDKARNILRIIPYENAMTIIKIL